MEDLFDQFSDLLAIGQIESTFDVPGREQTHKVRFGILWEDDLIRIKKRATSQAGADDRETRREIEVLETLVESIMEINEISFCDESDDNLHAVKKNNLRNILLKANPYLITFLYRKYSELVEQAYGEIERRVDEVKKSSPPLPKEKTATVDLK